MVRTDTEEHVVRVERSGTVHHVDAGDRMECVHAGGGLGPFDVEGAEVRHRGQEYGAVNPWKELSKRVTNVENGHQIVVIVEAGVLGVGGDIHDRPTMLVHDSLDVWAKLIPRVVVLGVHEDRPLFDRHRRDGLGGFGLAHPCLDSSEKPCHVTFLSGSDLVGSLGATTGDAVERSESPVGDRSRGPRDLAISGDSGWETSWDADANCQGRTNASRTTTGSSSLKTANPLLSRKNSRWKPRSRTLVRKTCASMCRR